MFSLKQMLNYTPYTAYTYAYPHKMAYRPFKEPLSLKKLWAEENRQALFLYIHVPFCEMRCGFCNLFTTANPATNVVAHYLDTLRVQAERVHTSLGAIKIARMALGGGTPTFLEPAELAQLFEITERGYGVVPGEVPTSVETSPLTATPERLQLLREHGVDRISIGVQSFLEEEARAAGRAQTTAQVVTALEAIRALPFPTLNIDLIYGLPGQTVATWLWSVRSAIFYQPEEIYLYPLYVRPLTGLALHQRQPQEDVRLACYRAAREILLENGYIQVSMRMFRAAHAPAETGPVYCVQEDGMVGLGCGARSYTRAYHYSNEYAVSVKGVRAVLADYIATPASAFADAHYGFHLDSDEQHRRYILKSLLETGGLDLAAYHSHFGSEALADCPELNALHDLQLVQTNQQRMELTPTGLEYSDTIGPWLYSARVQSLMKEYELR